MFPIPFNFPFIKSNGQRTTIGAAISEGGGSYTLPTASDSTKGGVKIGSGLTMTGEVLSNNNPTPYILPTASDENLGGVKVGSGLSIADGVLSPDIVTYEPALENGMSGKLRFLKDAKTGLITVSGGVLLETAMTTTRVKIANEINEAYRPGLTGNDQVSFYCTGLTSNATFVTVNVRIFGSGNVWVYPLDTSKAITKIFCNGQYFTDIFVTT